MRMLLAAALALAPVSAFAQDQTAPAPQATPTPAPTPTPAEPLKGSTRETAYKVKSIGEEYAIMRKLGLRVEMQALIFDGDHPYDVLTGTDPNTGEKREVWFDIKSFFGKEFG